jgi:drug/metabolite transporter (DMT)-like permease
VTSFLIRLYPAAWRARYGDEFEAVLEEQPLGPFDVVDILLGAVDAHLHLRGLDAASNRQRGFTMSLRLGGVAAILGPLLFLAGFVATSIDGSDDVFPGGALIIAGTAALLLALIGLSAFQARRHPRLIWAAFAIPALGTVVSCLGLGAMAVLGDRQVVRGVSPWDTWILGLFATVLGSALFAVATYRTGTLSRAAAAVLAAGSALLVAGFVVAAGLGPAITDRVAPALGLVGMLAFSAGWIALGWTAIRLERPVTAMT